MTVATLPDSSILSASAADSACGAPLLEVDDLRIVYGRRVAVDAVSFSVYSGEIFGLLGPNGAGKTSTLSAIEGLLVPERGTVRVAGIDVRQRPLDARANLGIQLQATSFQKDLSVAEIVRLYGGLYGVALTAGDVHRVLAAIAPERLFAYEVRPALGWSAPASIACDGYASRSAAASPR